MRSQFKRIEKEPFRVSDKVGEILRLAAEKKKMSFRGLLSAQSGKTELIVAFLAVLELMKMGSVVLKEAGDDDFILEASPELSENKEKLAEEIAGSLAF